MTQEMVRKEVATLDGPALDWAVTYLELRRKQADPEEHVKAWVARGVLEEARTDPYSTLCIWGDDIIEREGISIFRLPDNGSTPCWGATLGSHRFTSVMNGRGEAVSEGYVIDYFTVSEGPTRLVAAMRCYVGRERRMHIDVPKELV